jgi:Bacterial protein of unknown function (DUF885)
MVTNAPAFTAWLDDFFASYYRHRPVNATFIGVHADDERLPDCSERGLGDALADAEALLARLRDLSAEPLSTAEATDRALAQGFLEIQRWELASTQFQRGNPAFYTGEAAFGVISLLRRPFAPLEQRLEAAIRRMEAIPALLAQGRQQVRQAPEAWVERALDECDGLLKLLHVGIDLLIREHSTFAWRLRSAADRAAAAVDNFASYLRGGGRRDYIGGYACGDEAFDLLLRRGHFLTIDAAEIERYAQDQLAECEAYLREHAHDFGASAWQDALAQLANLHPTIQGYYPRYAELWDACRAAAEEHQLLTWPDYPIRYVPRPAWARAAAPHLYFLFYHSPAPFDALHEVDYLVTPIEPDMPAEEQERLLRANNDSAIKLNHVVHHGAIGHHVQNWHAFRAASRIGRVAAVDCAARIAMFCGGTMAEGWACYATDLMAEIGFLTALEHFAEHHTRLRMAARALADVRLHHGTWTLAQAAEFYQERVGMAPAMARAEAVKNSMFPATALMYLMGTDAIHELRRELAVRPGFELRAFHDQLLSYGSIPVALIATAMRQPVLL